MKKSDPIHIGEFHISSGSVRITDPCYDKTVWCSGSLGNVANGEWIAFVRKVDDGDWGIRVAELRVCLVGGVPTSPSQRTKFEVGVDSGQAGVFDNKLYQTDLKTPVACIGNLEYMNANQAWEHKRNKEQLADLETAGLQDSKMLEFLRGRVRYAEEYPPTMDPSMAEITTDFYNVCCDKTLSNMKAGTLEYGAVSSSGYGDGGYGCEYRTDENNKVVDITITFIGEETDEDDG